MIRKKSRIVLCVLVLWIALVWIITLPWMHQFDRSDYSLSILAHVSAMIWWLVLLWAFHHLAFQLVSLFRKQQKVKAKNVNTINKPTVAILYLTCDDFVPTSCQSCVNQLYPNFRVLICDDSNNEYYRRSIDEFAKRYPSKCCVVRRLDQRGFKAGNLNFSIENHVTEDWILLVDADQILSNSYLAELVSRIPNRQSDLAFIQAAHDAYLDSESTIFQHSLSPEVTLYYGRDMSARETYGFVPLLGHGALIPRSAWEEIGGFPERVSEDFAFALRASTKKRSGIYIEDVVSYEAVPKNFSAFMIRLKKFASGTAELFRTEMLSFLKGPTSITEKWDFWVSLSWYTLMPLVTINGFLAAYVVHRLWLEQIPYLHTIYPYLYIGLILVILAIHISVAQTGTKTLRFYFWSTAIYSSAMPLAGIKFIIHFLPFFPAVFQRTPKGDENNDLDISSSIFMSFLGFLALYFTFKWFSPFSPFLAGQGIAYLSYPVYSKLCSTSFAGRTSRVLIYIPGLLMLFAIYTMWEWGRF